MRLLAKWLIAASLSLVSMAVAASPANPVAGTDYLLVKPAQQTDANGKVEVLEFFAYSCPHCHAFDTPLSDWVKKQGGTIVFKRVPMAFSQAYVPQQKLYYTLEAMGKLDELHKKVFDAIHVARQPLNTEEAIIGFMEKHGIERKKFLEVYNSFGVQAKAGRVAKLQESYKINSVPTIAIGGQYLTSPGIVMESVGRQTEPLLHSAVLEVMGKLVAQIASEQSSVSGKK